MSVLRREHTPLLVQRQTDIIRRAASVYIRRHQGFALVPVASGNFLAQTQLPMSPFMWTVMASMLGQGEYLSHT
jgi:hypothetical protein